MSDGATLSPELEQDLTRVGSAEIVVAIPTYNNAETVAAVAQAAQTGLERYFSGRRAVILNADAGSDDGTPERFRGALGPDAPLMQMRYPVYPLHKLSTPPFGLPGRSEALRTILLAARRMGSRACVVLDPYLLSTTPAWVERLVQPVLDDDYDLVAPYYPRSKYDSALNTGLLYPLTRALYGKRIRLPMGSEFAVSTGMADQFLNGEPASNDGATEREPAVVNQAILGEFRIYQTPLGPRTVHAREAGADVSTLLKQALDPVLDRMVKNVAFWQRVRGSEEVPLADGVFIEGTGAGTVNTARMVESFRLGSQDLHEIWSLLLPPATLLELKKLARRPEAEFRLADEVWARTVYDFAVGYHFRVMDRNHLLRALTPIYLGWTGSFVLEMRDADPREVEQRVERLCVAFETQKRYLISRWRWPDRFNP